MKIAIPSLGRPNPLTLRQIPREWREHTTLYIAERELPDYSRWCQGCKLKPTGSQRLGLTYVREEIIQDHIGDKVLMIDDDLRFHDSAGKPLDGDGVRAMLLDLSLLLDHSPRVGITPNGDSIRDHIDTFPPICVMGFNLKRIPQAVIDDIDWHCVPLWEDVHTALEMLKRGYGSIMTHRYSWRSEGFNPGGLTETRKHVNVADCVAKLREINGEFMSDPIAPRSRTGEFDSLEAAFVVDWKRLFNSHNRNE